MIRKWLRKYYRVCLQNFNYVFVATEESKDLSTYSLNELMDSLEAHEQRFNESQERVLSRIFKQCWKFLLS